MTGVNFNNHSRLFTVSSRGRTLTFPYSHAEPRPGNGNGVVRACVDAELGREAFTFALADGREGAVHMDHVLEYNEDPEMLWKLRIHRLTVEVRKRLAGSALAKREVIRRLGTSPAQLYRLLDPAVSRKSLAQLFTILRVLNCDLDFVVRKRKPGPARRAAGVA